MKIRFLMSMLSFMAPAALFAADTPVPADFEQTVQGALSAWKIPGASVAVVQDGKVVYTKGFGLREIQRTEKVDADTMFGIASVTKLFVTTAIGVLVDEGKVELDRPVVHYLPQFRVADEFTTRNVTVRDMLSHRSGIAFEDSGEAILEQIATMDSADVVARAGTVPQMFPLRTKFSYNDFGFLVAAEILTRVGGQPWQQFIRKRVAEPLGLANTWMTPGEFLPRANVMLSGDGWSDSVPRGLASLPPALNIAAPHLIYGGSQPQLALPELTPRAAVVHFHRSPIDPAQSAWSSARDLAVFAQMWMNDGRSGEKQILQRDTVLSMNELASMDTPQWPLIRSPELDDRKSLTMAHQVAQSAGFAIFDYAGHILAGHDGGELGYSTLVRMDRSRGLAVVVLVNNALDDNGRFAKTVIANAILDWQYGLPAIDRTPIYLAEYEKASKTEVSEHEARVQRENAGRNLRIKPSLKSQAYAGVYEHPFVGELRVTTGSGDRLNATVGDSADWILKPWRGDIFEAQWLGAMPYRQFFRFEVSAGGEVTLLEILGDGLRYRKKS